MTADAKQDPSSPACLAHEADDAYMGFATQAEIAAFLKELAEVESAGRPPGDLLRKMLPQVRDDDLHRRLAENLSYNIRLCFIL